MLVVLQNHNNLHSRYLSIREHDHHYGRAKGMHTVASYGHKTLLQTFHPVKRTLTQYQLGMLVP